MMNEQARRASELADRSLRSLAPPPRGPSRPRTIVIRHSDTWQSLAFLGICLLLLAVVLLGQEVVNRLDRRHEETAATLAGVDRKIQQLESGIAFDSRRRHLLLGMRDHVLGVNPRVSLAEAYRYAALALEAGERYPAVDPLLLLAIGTVESRYDPQARSRADARGLYQIWPSTGRLLLRALGWEYDDGALYDPEKNTAAAALYLDILFSAYGDPQMVLAEYNGGPLNAGYFRAGARALAAETRDYVPKVIHLHRQLTDRFETGFAPHLELMHRDGRRDGKTLGGSPVAGSPVTRTAPQLLGTGPAALAPGPPRSR